jgi:hypothetical protein
MRRQMRFPQLGAALVLAVPAVLCAVAACSSSSGSTTPSTEGGSTACSDSIVNVFNNNPGVACPVDSNSNPSSFDVAKETTCDSLKQKTGDIQYGQCVDYLVLEVDLDSTGSKFTKCFYDPASHAFVGLIYSDGTTDQCGNSSATIQAGQVDTTCHIAGPSGGGGFQSCVPVVDGGAESSLLGSG